MKDAQPPTQPAKRRFLSLRKPTKRSALKLIIVLIVILGLTGGAYQFVSWQRTIPPPLSMETLSSVYYTIYYPSHIPSGYQLKKDSESSLNGLVSYKFKKGSKEITVTEQAAPKNSIDLGKLEGYKNITVPAGRAANGQSVGNPSVIIVTDTTIITIRSSQGVANDSVVSVARNMKPATQQNTR